MGYEKRQKAAQAQAAPAEQAKAVVTEINLDPAKKAFEFYDITFNPPGPFPKQWSGSDGDKVFTIGRGQTVRVSAAVALELKRALPEAFTIKGC
jgi:hypothetical protein